MTDYEIIKGTLFSFGYKNTFLSRHNELPYKTVSVYDSNWADCFDKYWGSYNSQEKFYFAFPACPIWITKFVDEFNSSMENIKIEIINIIPLWAVKNNNLYGSQVVKFYKEKPEVTYLREVCIPAFSIEYSKEYPVRARRYASYIIHHCLRMFSYPQKFLDISVDDPEKDYLDFLCLNLNNIRHGGSYTRNLSDDRITKDYILAMDSIEKANKFSSIYTIKQTSILDRFYNGREYYGGRNVTSIPFPEPGLYPRYSNHPRLRDGDYVRTENSVYTNTGYTMTLGRVISVNKNQLYVQVLINPRYPEGVGNVFEVESKYFFRVYSSGRPAKLRVGEY